MICCCSLEGTSACRTCYRYREEFQYPQYYIDYVKTQPVYIVSDSNRISELENAIKRLNERIDELLGGEE